ncbi:radical SAM protein [Streptomyces sp. CA2R106]|uniref:radical SAM protein n=1 Tax=Streptomyces sp. CA2R106 TaxID=3120153 RepID=UPI00300A86BA
MRVLEGKSGVWYLGPGSTVLMPKRFHDDGRLTAEGRAELARQGVEQPKPASRYSLTVVTSTACNLGCPYCFQNTEAAEPGRFDPPRIAREVLDRPMIEKIAAFTEPRLRASGLDRLFVLLFGGEPLLNRWGCVELLGRLSQLAPLTASMVSNGVLLTARTAAKLEAAGLRSVQITLDGPRELHDGTRFTRAGRGTFDKVLANCAAVQEATDLRLSLRLNTTAEGLPLLGGLVADLAQRLDPARCNLDIAPVLNYDGMFDPVMKRSAADVDVLLQAYADALELGFTVGWPGGSDCGFCGRRDGSTGAVINADGTLYSCWETIGKAGYEVGSVEGGYTDYPAERWVSCGEFAVSATTAAQSQAFDDALTVGLLEMLRARMRRAAAQKAAQAQETTQEAAQKEAQGATQGAVRDTAQEEARPPAPASLAVTGS